MIAVWVRLESATPKQRHLWVCLEGVVLGLASELCGRQERGDILVMS